LLRHIKSSQEEKEKSATKKTLIGDNDSDDDESTPLTNEAVWLILTTKKHVVDKNRLKPGKITIPHSLNSSPSLSICVITADPQRGFKDVVADPAFPQELSSRIEKVIGFSKLKARYQSFESRRQLFSEHDVFLADDRIITRLIPTLGKIFYKSSKRPIPIRIAEIEKVDGKRVKKDPKAKKPSKEEKSASFAAPLICAKEIERTLNCAAIHLAPSTSSAIRVGSSNFTAEQLSENIAAVVNGMAEKFINKGWRNIKAVHVKGANTMALPIWLANELWVEDADVVEEDQAAIEAGAKAGKKRKSIGDEKLVEAKKTKKTKSVEDEDEAESAAARKEKLQKQKAKALEDGEAVVTEAPKAGKKKRKSIS
jgi:ribosome biogenesis protein UTP30